MSEHVTDTEPYLLAEEVAERLGLPLSVLLRRVEAGDVPSQRVERDDGMHYALRLSDLGIETADFNGEDLEHERDDADDEPDGINVFDESGSREVEQAIASAFNPGMRAEGEDAINIADASVWHHEEHIAEAVPEASHGESWPVHEEATPAWSSRPLEPQEPPVWIKSEARSTAVEETKQPPLQSQPTSEAADESEVVATGHVVADSATAPADAPPFRERRRAPERGLIDAGADGPRTDVASMSLDARDLVAGLLDRWERTLEQRIYTEQRQRFQGELTARQNMVKQLQMELQTARAEHAAAQAEKDRVLAAKERELAERDRDLADTRRQAEEAERMHAPATPRRRRWFRTRGND
jgi:hypothetical protein